MKVIVNNIEINKVKQTMDLLMNCIKDKNIDMKTKKEYYSEYLQLSKSYLLLSK
jgi:hypothetical protein